MLIAGIDHVSNAIDDRVILDDVLERAAVDVEDRVRVVEVDGDDEKLLRRSETLYRDWGMFASCLLGEAGKGKNAVVPAVRAAAE